MNERTVKLTLEKAKEWYKAGGELKLIALQAFTEKELSPLPRTWEEYRKTHKSKFSALGYFVLDNEYQTAFSALEKLIALRQAWVGDWKPNFKMNMAFNWTVEYHPNPGTWDVENHCWTNGGPLTFPTQEMCKEFFGCFKDLYNEAKILL